MSISSNDFLEGLDPSGLSQISGAQLLQMIREATPMEESALFGRFIGIADDDTPDTTTYPRFKRYLWLKPSEDFRVIRTWSEADGDWYPISLGSNIITTTMIQNAAVTLAKLSVSGGSALQLIRVNAAGNGFEFFTPSTPAGSITIAQLDAGSGNANKLVKINSGGNAFEFFTLNAVDYISDNTIASAKLISLDPAKITAVIGDAAKYLRVNASGVVTLTNLSGSDLANQAVALSKLVSTDGTEGQIMTIVSGVWAPATITPSAIFTSANSRVYTRAIPALGTTDPFNHGIVNSAGVAVVPNMLKVYVKCITTEHGYAVGDRVVMDFASDTVAGFTLGLNTTQIFNTRDNAASVIRVISKSTFTSQTIDTTKWQLEYHVGYVPES